MSGSIIGAVRAGDLVEARSLLDAGADVHARDEHEWTPLNWAAGRGDMEMVRLLVERGADVYKVGRDERTPYLIALAAGHAPVARFLRDIERRTGDPSQSSGREKSYCKAYYSRDLRRWPAWSEKALGADDDVVFIHQDFTVTKSMWHGEDVLLGDVTAEWRQFCADELAFAVPDDIEAIENEKASAAPSPHAPRDGVAIGQEAVQP